MEITELLLLRFLNVDASLDISIKKKLIVFNVLINVQHVKQPQPIVFLVRALTEILITYVRL
jgi:hypothetical protein